MSVYDFLSGMGRNGLHRKFTSVTYEDTKAEGSTPNQYYDEGSTLGTVVIECGETVWFCLKDKDNTGGTAQREMMRCMNEKHPYEIKLQILEGAGDASIDGQPLSVYEGNRFDGGRISYFVHSWGGQVKIGFDATRCSVKWERKTTGLNAILLNCFNYNKILVVDNCVSSAIIIANYFYMKEPLSSNNRSSTFVDLNVMGNLGISYIYPMISGTIPPHHPSDWIPNLKQGFFIGNQPKDLNDFVEKEVGKLPGKVVGFVDYNYYRAYDNIKNLMKLGKFDICFTTSDLLVSELRSENIPVFHYNQPFAGVPRDMYLPVEDINVVIQRHIFKSIVKPHHLSASARIIERVLDSVDVYQRSENNRFYSINRMDARTVYGLIVYKKDQTPAFWGFCYCDNNGHIHTLLPENVLLTCHLIRIGQCLID